jgi:uncharacterized protein (DUF433 family)
MSTAGNHYTYLAPDPDSSYRQLRVKGRRIFARTLYSLTIGEEGRMTPEEVAADYQLPLEAVHEAIGYCEGQPPEIAEDFDQDEAHAATKGSKPAINTDYSKDRLLTSEDQPRGSRS